MNRDEAVEVQQCDRDAAADFLEGWEPGPEMTVVKLATAFARHRLTAAEPFLEQARAGEWMPIETAPKDGMVLVAGHWDDGRDWRAIGHCVNPGVVGGWDHQLEPTHWRPLPDPPRSLSPKQGEGDGG